MVGFFNIQKESGDFMDFYREISDAFEEMRQTRRFLHMHPELSFKETKTAAFITAQYDAMGVHYESNFGGGYGIVAQINGANPGKTIALRADFDALPIHDQKEVPYRSQTDNVSHSCGHDGHTAMLLTIARILKRHEKTISGNYVLIHQPAEEHPPGGAIDMIKAGCLNGVDAIFGTHLWSLFESGHIYTTQGPLMAAASNFKITLIGKGGHGGAPQTSVDAIALTATVIQQLQQIVSRRLNPLSPAVLSVGAIEAGETYNIIAEKAILKGTVRVFDDETKKEVYDEMTRILQGICLSAGASYELNIIDGYPPVINDDRCAQFLHDFAYSVPAVIDSHFIQPLMVGEDFAYYLEQVPGVFFLTGAKPKSGIAYPHHHGKFDFDEEAMIVGAQTMLGAVLKYQET